MSESKQPEYVDYCNELYLRRPPDIIVQPSSSSSSYSYNHGTSPLSRGKSVGVFSRIALIVMTYYMMTLFNAHGLISSMFVYCFFTFILWNSCTWLIQSARKTGNRIIKIINS